MAPTPPATRFASAAELADALGVSARRVAAFLRQRFRICRGQSGRGQIIAEPPHYLDAWIEVGEEQRRRGDPAVLYRVVDVWGALLIEFTVTVASRSGRPNA